MAKGADRLLHVLRETLRAEVGSDHPDLNLRQLGILLVVCQIDELQSAGALTGHLRIPKASVSRALDHLEDLDLAYRVIDDRDRRSMLVQRTIGGAAMMERLKATMTEAADKAVGPVIC